MLILIKKDCRVNAVAIAGSVILQAMIYIVMVILGTIAWWKDGITRADIEDAMITSSFLGLTIMVLMAAVYGAGAFALERRERSSDFLAMFPVGKWRIIVSKLVTAAACLLAIWLINVLVLLLARRGSIFGPLDVKGFPLADRGYLVMVLTNLALMAFGMAWLFSSFTSSASVAASISIATTIAMVIVVQLILHYAYPSYFGSDGTFHRPEEFEAWLIPQAAIWVGMVSLAAGTIHYMLRVEP